MGPGPVAPEQVRSQLRSVLASRLFLQATRASRFLEFVVNAALDGESGAVKETTIGVAVFDRDPGYDPKTDPVVRNAARRLRDLLDRYYADEGQRDALRFSLPKGGYALQIDAVAPPAVPEERANEAPPRPRPVWRVRGAAAMLGAFGIGLLVYGVVMWRPGLGREAKIHFEVSPVTASLGESFQPAFAPNSRDVAYVWDGGRGPETNYDVYIRIAGQPPQRLTTDPAHDLHPAWSPAGDRIAYVRVSRGDTSIFTRPVTPGGVERKVTTISGLYYGIWQPEAPEILGSPGPAWMPDGKALLITTAAEDGRCCGLFEVSIDGSYRRRVTSPPDGAHNFYPTVSPDHRYIAFARYRSHSTAAIHILDRETRETRQLTFDYADVRGLAWTADSQTLVFSSNRGGSYGLWELPLATAIARVIAAPGRNAREPAVSRDGQLIFVEVSDQVDLMRADFARPDGPLGPGVPFAPSSLRTHSPRFSPDGRQVSFLSDRSGTLEIWVADADGAAVRQVTRMGGPYVGSPHWSPDGRQIVFDSRVDGHSAIFVVPVEGGPPRRLSVNAFEEKRPSWSRDGRWIYFTSNRSGEARLWRLPAAGGSAQQVTERLAYENSESTDGRALYFTDRNMGMWRVAPHGGPAEPLAGLEGTRADLDWIVTGRGIVYIDDLAARDEVRFYDFARQRSHRLALFARPLASAIPSLAVSPDRRRLIYAQTAPRQSDLVSVRGWDRD